MLAESYSSEEPMEKKVSNTHCLGSMRPDSQPKTPPCRIFREEQDDDNNYAQKYIHYFGVEISGDDKTRSSIQATCARIIVDRDKPDTRPPHGLEPPGPRGAGKYSIHHQQSRSQGPGPERPAESKDPELY
ncbi:hypothetical protein JTE90_018868 [Oedothorax gibbosus]|uniref:Uncharacterized protein n=1 Tax=Oedothorax gibbosus TaxID=931172 RepID=A0AAV6TU70_9ARAC|nr:hypothetical protein JTE90_018868 [Oedothorax gibbosus]